MEVQPLIQKIQSAVPGLFILYQFGSQAQGQAGPESDIDLAILAADPVPVSTLLALQEDLAGSLKKDVDLVDLRAASTVLRMQVVSNGQCLYSAVDAGREEFEDFVYSAYARLNEERRGILEDIRARGSVYGR